MMLRDVPLLSTAIPYEVCKHVRRPIDREYSFRPASAQHGDVSNLSLLSFTPMLRHKVGRGYKYDVCGIADRSSITGS